MSSSRPIARLGAGSLGLALAAVGLSFVGTPAAHAADPVVINLVGINDFHGRIDSNTVKWAGTVEQTKALRPAADTLFVGAGDLVGASLFASATANDQPTIDVLNELGLQASSHRQRPVVRSTATSRPTGRMDYGCHPATVSTTLTGGQSILHTAFSTMRQTKIASTVTP